MLRITLRPTLSARGYAYMQTQGIIAVRFPSQSLSKLVEGLGTEVTVSPLAKEIKATPAARAVQVRLRRQHKLPKLICISGPALQLMRNHFPIAAQEEALAVVTHYQKISVFEQFLKHCHNICVGTPGMTMHHLLLCCKQTTARGAAGSRKPTRVHRNLAQLHCLLRVHGETGKARSTLSCSIIVCLTNLEAQCPTHTWSVISTPQSDFIRDLIAAQAQELPARVPDGSAWPGLGGLHYFAKHLQYQRPCRCCHC